MNVHSLRKTLGSIALALGLVACGDISEHDGPVPPDGSIVIAPSALTVTTVTGGVDCTDNVVIQRLVQVSTFDQSGLPRGNVDITLFIDFADIGITGIGAIGVPGGSTTTDDEGNALFLIFLNVSTNCEYAGSLTVSSGSVVEDMPFDVAN